MTVYVDDMHAAPMGRFGRMKMSHMIADSDEELHAMAARIGAARKWFQKAGTPTRHYDIAMTRRALAVTAGAVQITMRQAAGMCAHRRHFGVLCQPGTAATWRAALEPFA